MRLSAAVLLTACHGQRGLRSIGEYADYDWQSIDGFRFGAHAAIVGSGADTLWVNATAENLSKHRLAVTFGRGCGRDVNSLAVVAQHGVKTWDSRTWEIHRQPIEPVHYDSTGQVIPVLCAGQVYMVIVLPGGLRRYELRVPVNEILGDSLPPGRYGIVARLSINGCEIKNLRAGEVEFRQPPTNVIAVVRSRKAFRFLRRSPSPADHA